MYSQHSIPLSPVHTSIHSLCVTVQQLKCSCALSSFPGHFPKLLSLFLSKFVWLYKWWLCVPGNACECKSVLLDKWTFVLQATVCFHPEPSKHNCILFLRYTCMCFYTSSESEFTKYFNILLGGFLNLLILIFDLMYFTIVR